MTPETIADVRANFPEDRGPEFAKGWIAACDRLDALLDALLDIERQSATLALADVAGLREALETVTQNAHDDGDHGANFGPEHFRDCSALDCVRATKALAAALKGGSR